MRKRTRSAICHRVLHANESTCRSDVDYTIATSWDCIMMLQLEYGDCSLVHQHSTFEVHIDDLIKELFIQVQ